MGMLFGDPYIIGPLVLLAVVGALALVLRWTYGTSSRSLPALDEPADFGLLRELAIVENDDTTEALRALLSDAGIRSTRAYTPQGTIRVLVFATDLDRARQLVGPR
jgi:hypothetical protein